MVVLGDLCFITLLDILLVFPSGLVILQPGPLAKVLSYARLLVDFRRNDPLDISPALQLVPLSLSLNVEILHILPCWLVVIRSRVKDALFIGESRFDVVVQTLETAVILGFAKRIQLVRVVKV